MNIRDHFNTELTTWLNSIYQIEKRPTKNLHKWLTGCSSLLGISIGAASAYIMYILSADFGENTCDYLGITTAVKKSALINILGLTAAIPMAALASLNVNDSLKALSGFLSKPQINSKLLFKKKTLTELTTRGLFAIAAPFSSIPQSTLTWNHVTHSGARVFFTACSVAGPTFFNGRGGQKLIGHCKPKSKVVLEIVSYLEKCQALLKKMSEEEFQTFLQKILAPEGELSNDFLLSLFSLDQKDAKTETTLAQKVFSFAGGSLGLVSAIIFYQLTLEGLENPLQLQNLGLQHLLSVLAYLLNAALSCLSTAKVFEGMYALLFGIRNEALNQTWPKIRKMFACLAILIGPFAALPLGSLQLANAQEGSIWQKLLVGPTFLGPTCVRSSALYDLLNRSFDYMVKALQTTSPADSKRAALLKTVKELQLSINELNSETLNALETTKESGQGLRVQAVI